MHTVVHFAALFIARSAFQSPFEQTQAHRYKQRSSVCGCGRKLIIVFSSPLHTNPADCQPEALTHGTTAVWSSSKIRKTSRSVHRAKSLEKANTATHGATTNQHPVSTRKPAEIVDSFCYAGRIQRQHRHSPLRSRLSLPHMQNWSSLTVNFRDFQPHRVNRNAAVKTD